MSEQALEYSTRGPVYETRTVALAVGRPGEPLFSEQTTHVRIIDEAAGEFVEVEQHGSNDSGLGKVWITSDEWPALRDAIDRLLAECKQT
jgi:hypothetical protein